MDKNIYALKKLHLYRDHIATLTLIDKFLTNYIYALKPFIDVVSSPPLLSIERQSDKDKLIYYSKSIQPYYKSIKSLEEYVYDETIYYKTKINSMQEFLNVNNDDQYVVDRLEKEKTVKNQSVCIEGIHRETSFRKNGIIDGSGIVYLYLDRFDKFVSTFYLGNGFIIKEFDDYIKYNITGQEFPISTLARYKKTCYCLIELLCVESSKKYIELFEDSFYMDESVKDTLLKLFNIFTMFNKFTIGCMASGSSQSIYEYNIYI